MDHHPLEWASRIISEQPERSEDLYNLLVWATSSRDDPIHEAELDKVEQMIYAHTGDSNRHRESFRKSLLSEFVRDREEELISPGS